MNSDVSSSENELSQDGSLQNDSNENSESSHTSNQSSNKAEVSDNPELALQDNNDSLDSENDQGVFMSDTEYSVDYLLNKMKLDSRLDDMQKCETLFGLSYGDGNGVSNEEFNSTNPARVIAGIPSKKEKRAAE